MSLSDEIKANYEGVRASRGWSWAQMAEQFAKDGEKALAEWARSLVEDRPRTAKSSKPAEKAVPPKAQ